MSKSVEQDVLPFVGLIVFFLGFYLCARYLCRSAAGNPGLNGRHRFLCRVPRPHQLEEPLLTQEQVVPRVRQASEDNPNIVQQPLSPV